MNIIPITDTAAPNTKTWEEWTSLICSAWQKGVELILETGQMLIQAKEELEHGTFQNMVQLKLPFGSRTARRLMTIARHPVPLKTDPVRFASLLDHASRANQG